MMRDKLIKIAIMMGLVLLMCGHAMAWAATYYVDKDNTQSNDSNPGTQALPWKTIGKASTTMVAGDTVIVNAGTYSENLSPSQSGTSGNRITYRASGTVNINTANINMGYITVDGFTVIGGTNISSTGDCRQYSFQIGANGNYLEILNNHFIGTSIFWNYVSPGETPTGMLVKGNRLEGYSCPEGDCVVMHIFGTNHIIENNEIGPASDIDAFRLWGHDNIIRNNYVHDLTYTIGGAAHMDIVQTFALNNWWGYDNIIENNLFINSESQMMMLESNANQDTRNFTFRNNVFANFNVNSEGKQVNANLGITGINFFNNTFYNVGIFSGGNIPVTFKNNIFIHIKSYDPTNYEANMFMHTVPWTMEYNFYSTLSGNPLTNFDNQTGGINGGAINFTNSAAGDFSIRSPSPVINAGTTLSGFNYDRIGTSRPQAAAWDMGAYEYASTHLSAPTNLRILP